ncbi:hypothetical protein COLO4_01943 [Corchorus olitorius]|uniref:Uncharacterized protein n=1 Tax=Corchorus olitorius TaxID=93759 RepID=A0A1R3L1R1_9ROSI|nr:hypothetical protein COLO4_01943 [Corchorus olitorius]
MAPIPPANDRWVSLGEAANQLTGPTSTRSWLRRRSREGNDGKSDPMLDAVKEFETHVDFAHRQAQLLKALDQATQVAKQFQPPIHTMAEWCVTNPSQAKEELQRQLTAVGIQEELADYAFIQCVSLQQADLARQQVE